MQGSQAKFGKMAQNQKRSFATQNNKEQKMNHVKNDELSENQNRIEQDEQLDVRSIVIKTIVGIILLIALVGGLGYMFRDPITALSKDFVQKFGGFGVAFGFFIVDGLTVPIPNDLFTFLGYKGGLGFWNVVLLATAGSLMGGSLGYGIGMTLAKTKFMQSFMKGRAVETYTMIQRYGLIALAVAAFTPVPYSIATWASGVVRIPFGQFLLVSLLRLPRIALYLWLIQIGFVKFAT